MLSKILDEMIDGSDDGAAQVQINTIGGAFPPGAVKRCEYDGVQGIYELIAVVGKDPTTGGPTIAKVFFGADQITAVTILMAAGEEKSSILTSIN